MKVGDKVRPKSGVWPCGCANELGDVMELDDTVEEWFGAIPAPHAKVRTNCFWQWFPVTDLEVTSEG